MDIKFLLVVLLIIGIVIILYQQQYVGRTVASQDKTFVYNNSIQNYSVIGKGKPIILLHGSMISHPWGSEFETTIGKHFQVFLPDLPGFGGSDGVHGEIHNTKLFAEAFCEFLNATHNESTPVIAFSLGTVVAVHSAVYGCLKGSMILIGTPGKVQSDLLKHATNIPVVIRRFLASTKIGREKMLIPVLWDVIGVKGDIKTSTLPEKLKTTDVRSLVDLDVYREIELEMPELLKRVSNKITYVYGQKDGVRKTTEEFIKDPIIIQGADHNVFTSQPDKMLDFIIKTIK